MPFFWITTVFILGIVLAGQIQCPVRQWAGLALGFWFLAGELTLISRKLPNRFPAWIYACLPATRLRYLFLPALLFSGGWAFQAQLPGQGTLYASLPRSDSITVSGRVVDFPDRREDKTYLAIQASGFTSSDGQIHATAEKILLVLPANTPYEYGDELQIRGHPVLPGENEDFSYREYLAGQKIFSIFYYPRVLSAAPLDHFDFFHLLYSFKEQSLQMVDQLFPMPSSALMKGILLGEDQNIPANLYKAFRASGTTHIIAISGFNVSIVTGFILLLSENLFGKKRGILGSLPAILLYTLLVGASPSVVRAALMGSLGIIGMFIGRKGSGVNTVFLTAGVMLLFNPYLLYSISFQLSVAATLGLVLYGDALQERTVSVLARYTSEGTAARLGAGISEYFLFTIAAQIPTFPFLLHHFKSLPLVSLLSNPLVLPAQPPVMILGSLSLLGAWIFQPLGNLLALLCQPFVSYTLWVIEWTSQIALPGFASAGVSLLACFCWILVLTLPESVPAWKKALKQLNWLWLVFGLLAIAVFLGIHQTATRPDDYLTVTWMGGDQPAGILIRTPVGNRILIGGGSSSNRLLAFLEPRLDLYPRRLDAVILTGNSSAQTAEDLLPNLSVEGIYAIPHVESSVPQSIPFSSGDTLALDEEVYLRNDAGDLWLTYHQFSLGLIFQTDPTRENYGCNVCYFSGEVPVLPSSSQVTLTHLPQTESNPLSLANRDWLEIKTDGNQLWLSGK